MAVETRRRRESPFRSSRVSRETGVCGFVCDFSKSVVCGKAAQDTCSSALELSIKRDSEHWQRPYIFVTFFFATRATVPGGGRLATAQQLSVTFFLN